MRTLVVMIIVAVVFTVKHERVLTLTSEVHEEIAQMVRNIRAR